MQDKILEYAIKSCDFILKYHKNKQLFLDVCNTDITCKTLSLKTFANLTLNFLMFIKNDSI